MIPVLSAPREHRRSSDLLLLALLDERIQALIAVPLPLRLALFFLLLFLRFHLQRTALLVLSTQLVSRTPIQYLGRIAVKAQTVCVLESGDTSVLLGVFVKDRERVVFADDAVCFFLDRLGSEMGRVDVLLIRRRRERSKPWGRSLPCPGNPSARDLLTSVIEDFSTHYRPNSQYFRTSCPVLSVFDGHDTRPYTRSTGLSTASAFEA